MEEENLITGIILAGGKSSRMGYDKGLAMVNGDRMIELVYASLKQVVDKVIIIANTDSYNFLNLPVFEDEFKDKGPIGGIYTGLFHSTTEKNVIVACDMPFVTPQLLVHLLEHIGNNQIVVPSFDGNIEPLCGFYKKEILEQVEELIGMDVLPVHKAIQFFDYLTLKINSENINNATVFTNINRPEDIQQLETSAHRKTELDRSKAHNSSPNQIKK
jgi:molybdenum cofactor guanylyltransferase